MAEVGANVVSLYGQIEREEPPETGGGNGGGPTVDAHTRDYVDSRTEATRAQNDARFATVIEKLDAQKSATWQQILVIVAGAVATGIATILGILAFAADRFDGGMAHGENVATQSTEAKALADKNAAAIQKLNVTVTETNQNVGELVELIKSGQLQTNP